MQNFIRFVIQGVRTRLMGRLAVVLLFLLMTSLVFAQTELPDSVTVAGTIQSQLGCSDDWQPECEDTMLDYDEGSGIWRGSFDLVAGEYLYKAALNGSWTLNYGASAEEGGADIPLVLDEDATVDFYFDHETGWITENVSSLIANVSGDFQSEVGCPGEWAPECLQTWLQDSDRDGVYVYEAVIPAGDWEAKVAVDEEWEVNYGIDGEPDGENIPFVVEADSALVTFSFDSSTNVLDITVGDAIDASASDDEEGESEEPSENNVLNIEALVADWAQEDVAITPEMVTIAGTVQSVLGCPGDWQPECEATMLTYDAADNIWRGSFDLPAGSYLYKAALNGTWDDNFGDNAEYYGTDIPLELEEDTTVEFFYDHETGWITDSVRSIIANVPGSFQRDLGCPTDEWDGGNWGPSCLISWLQDLDGDGVYIYTTADIPVGNYEAKVAVNESWSENYGVGGSLDGANFEFSVPDDDARVVFVWDSETSEMAISVLSDAPALVGNIGRRAAHWVSEDTLVWQVDAGDDGVYKLHYSVDGELALTPEGVQGGESITLTPNPTGMGEEAAIRLPHLTNWPVFTIAEEDLALVPEILRGQITVSAVEADGTPVDATGVQIPGVLDDLYANDASLGLTLNGDVPTIRVWAPTAQNVVFHLFADSEPATLSDTFEMTRDDVTGIWSVTGDSGWMNQYYLFEVTVFAPTENAIVTNVVTDPYSVSLAMNSTRSQIVDLNDPTLMPDGWQTYEKPEFTVPEDIVVYELHVRDFSIFDETVPEEFRGTFMAFTVAESNGMAHLSELADSGLTHLHLLPLFDLATINEDVSARVEPDVDELASFGPADDSQQGLINPIRDEDGFNWGYDPYHFNVPEGSYATDPDGTQRIIEFREMVMAINETGLRVVVDVVYNHTNAAGQGEKSVFDRIVPGYYHRLDPRNGNVLSSSCCPNTASEHVMMRKFMVESVQLWTEAYKVDGYRFDLMGLHDLNSMIAVREGLDQMTVEENGVNGEDVYVYGEGWTMPDDGQIGEAATQSRIAGTGIGVFNDRLRDAVRGGSPFDGRQHQGFISDLYFNPNGVTPGNEAAQLAQLLQFGDLIRVGLAGNLADYTFEDVSGDVVTGLDVIYGTSTPAGYTSDPQENIIYVSKHDNETLWDIIMYKGLDVPVAEHVRMHNLGNSFTMFSQGIPFFQAGDDLLRSKSLDRNSYNSGDWFNRIDFTYQTNNWGIGLPLAGDNGERWDVMRPLLEDESRVVGVDEIAMSRAHFNELLAIRSDVALLRLQTGEQIMEMVRFHNTGPDQIPGLIVMSVTDSINFDPDYDLVVVLFNVSPESISFTEEVVAGMNLELHPIFAESADAIVREAVFDSETGTFTVPARTAALFVVRGE